MFAGYLDQSNWSFFGVIPAEINPTLVSFLSDFIDELTQRNRHGTRFQFTDMDCKQVWLFCQFNL